MAGHQAASRQVSVNSAFTWSLLLCDGYQFCTSNTWVLQHHSVHALDMNAIIVLCIWCCSSNEINLAQTTLAIWVVYIRGCMLGSDLTQWPPNQIMSVHWDTTGQTTLEPQWPMQPVVFQWQSNCIEIHWKTTGATSTLGCHWNHTGWC